MWLGNSLLRLASHFGIWIPLPGGDLVHRPQKKRKTMIMISRIKTCSVEAVAATRRWSMKNIICKPILHASTLANCMWLCSSFSALTIWHWPGQQLSPPGHSEDFKRPRIDGNLCESILYKLVIPSAKIFQQDAYPPNTGFLPTFFTEHQQNAWKNNSTPKPFQAKPQTCDTVAKSCTIIYLIELDDGKFYRKNLYLMVKTMVSCRFSLKSIHYLSGGVSRFSQKIGVYPSTSGWNSWNQPGAFLAAAGGRFEDVLPPGLKWPETDVGLVAFGHRETHRKMGKP